MNIAEILKTCPKGRKLYSPMYGEVTFSRVNDLDNIEIIDQYESKHVLYPSGKYYSVGECVIFPSKENRDWTRPFTNGDIIIATEYIKGFEFKNIAVFKEYSTDSYCNPISVYGQINAKEEVIPQIHSVNIQWRWADEYERSLFFKKLEEKGFRLDENYRFKKKIFDKSSLKPYDKVLAKTAEDSPWYPTLVSFVDRNQVFTLDAEYSQDYVIPFEGHEHLIGTNNNPDKYYITW